MLMKYRLFTPGPTSVPEATLLELAKPVRHHRTGEFRAMFNEIQTLLQYIYQTRQQVHTITGSGDMLCRVVAPSNAELQHTIDSIVAVEGVRRTSTVIALATLVPYRSGPLVARAGDRGGAGG